MIRKGIITLALLCVLTPNFSAAQTVSEQEYRAYLFALIELLEQQIAVLQFETETTVPVVGKIVRPVTSTHDFESFLIEDEDDVLFQYEISDPDQVSGIENDTHRTYFSRFFDLVPDEYDDYFIDLVVFEEDSYEFDGFVETVPPYRDDTWRFGVNESVFEFGTRSQMVEELFIHEFAHIISYEGISGRGPASNNRCHEFFSNFGCPPSNSYLVDFIDEFWDEEDLDALVEADDGDSIWTNREVRNNFVTDYASTNPTEDFAESFTFFVLENKTSGSKLLDKKIKYFYDFEQMVNLRDEIRSQI